MVCGVAESVISVLSVVSPLRNGFAWPYEGAGGLEVDLCPDAKQQR